MSRCQVQAQPGRGLPCPGSTQFHEVGDARVRGPRVGDPAVAQGVEVTHLQERALLRVGGHGRCVRGGEHGAHARGADRRDLGIGEAAGEGQHDVGLQDLPQRPRLPGGVWGVGDEAVARLVQRERCLLQVAADAEVQRPVGQHDQHDAAASAGQRPRGGVRAVPQAGGLGEHPFPGLRGDRLAGGVVEHEADRRPRETERSCDVGGGDAFRGCPGVDHRHHHPSSECGLCPQPLLARASCQL